MNNKGSSSASQQFAVSLGVTVTTTAFAVMSHIWPWPNAVVGAALLLSSSIYLIDRLGIGLSTKARVRDWLDATGYLTTTVSDNNAFHFALVDNFGLRTNILQTKAGEPIQIIVGGLKPSSAELAAQLTATTEAMRERFWRPIRRELVGRAANFTQLKLQDEGVTISAPVVVSRTTTAVEFQQQVLEVRATARLYLDMINGGLIDALTPKIITSLTATVEEIGAMK